jgi:capsular exopolysaccharide synthesis family protein
MNTIEFDRRGAAVLAPSELGNRNELTFAVPEPVGERAPMLAQLLSILRRRKWIILGAITAALLVGLLVTLLTTPLYTASATLEIRREGNSFVDVQGAEPKAAFIDQEFYQTQYGLLRARSLAERVATDLRLYDDQRFFETFSAPQAGTWFENGRPLPGASTRDERIRVAGDILIDNLTVSPERLSRLVVISFTSPDPALSKRVVDAWSANFIQQTLERRFEATSYARRFLEQRLQQLRGRIDQSERQLVDYASREGIVNLPATGRGEGGAAQGGERSLIAEDLVALNQELAQAIADRMRAQSRLSSSAGTATESLQYGAIGSLRQRRAELAAEYARLMTQFEPQYPAALALQTQLQQIDRAISREEARVQSSLREAYQSSVTRERSLQSRVDQLKAGMLDLRRRSIQYNIIQRDADTNRQLYDALLQRYKEIGVAGGVGVNNIVLVDTAELPQRPSSPSIPLNMALALMLGALAGVGGALALEQIDEAFADPTEVQEALGLPLLGTVPRISSGDPLSELNDRKSPLSEAYFSVHTSLAFSTDHGVPKSCAVTSTRPGEGKSTTSYAIARALARANQRTLLVDADMRSPSIHHFLGIANESGLSNYLTGSDDLAALVTRTTHDGLYAMTAGPQPPSAAELLSSDRFDKLVKELSERFDNVVFDAPPIMGLADAPLIGSRVEGIIYVVETHGTKRSLARLAIARLSAANAQIIGAVLTKFDAKRASYGYGYDYGYGYGAEAGEQKNQA